MKQSGFGRRSDEQNVILDGCDSDSCVAPDGLIWTETPMPWAPRIIFQIISINYVSINFLKAWQMLSSAAVWSLIVIVIMWWHAQQRLPASRPEGPITTCTWMHCVSGNASKTEVAPFLQDILVFRREDEQRGKCPEWSLGGNLLSFGHCGHFMARKLLFSSTWAVAKHLPKQTNWPRACYINFCDPPAQSSNLWQTSSKFRENLKIKHKTKARFKMAENQTRRDLWGASTLAFNGRPVAAATCLACGDARWQLRHNHLQFLAPQEQ